MRYKSKVLKRFPDARTVVVAYWPWSDPRYVVIQTGQVTGNEEEGFDYTKVLTLDINTGPSENNQQLAAAAWRSAYYWCVRNPAPREEKEAA